MLPLSENELDDLVARERERGAPPLTDWDSLAARLRAEGLMRQRTFAGISAGASMRVAAAILLVVGGAAIGRATAARPARTANTTGSPVSPNLTGQTAAV